MSAQTTITLNNGASSPVAVAFDPKGAKTSATDKDVALWRNQSASTALGFLTITEQHARPNGNGIEKFRYVIEVPVTEVPSGGTAPVVAYTVTGVVEVWLPMRASEDNLKDIAAFLKNFTANAYFTNAVTKREAAW